MSFCTVVNCMDGRTQSPVNDHLRNRNQVEYVDTITEAGPVKALAEGLDVTLFSAYGRELDGLRAAGNVT